MPFAEHQNSGGGGGGSCPHRRGGELGARTAVKAMKQMGNVRGVCHECAAFTMANTALVIAAGLLAFNRGVDIDTAFDVLLSAARDKYHRGNKTSED